MSINDTTFSTLTQTVLTLLENQERLSENEVNILSNLLLGISWAKPQESFLPLYRKPIQRIADLSCKALLQGGIRGLYIEVTLQIIERCDDYEGIDIYKSLEGVDAGRVKTRLDAYKKVGK